MRLPALALLATAAVTVLLAPAPAASAARRPDPVARLLACRAIEASAKRLACFDRQSAALLAARNGSSPELRPATPPSLSPRRTFGLPEGAIAERERKAGLRAPALTHMSARLIRLGEGADGQLVFTLDNGEVWAQIEPDRAVLVSAGAVVRISRQLFGSYWMRLPSGRGFKVTRVR